MKTAEQILRRNPRFAKQMDEQTRAQIRREIPPLNEAEPKPKRGKMNAQRTTTATGETFDSKHEARIISQLRAAYGKENIITQVSIPLEDVASGSRRARMRIDAMRIIERFPDGSFRAELLDPKGFETRAWKRSQQWLRDKHGIEVKTL